jgi:hypothetical protein
MEPEIKTVQRKTVNASDLYGRRVNARYDAASTTNENANLWSNADAMSAAAANSPRVRKVIKIGRAHV